MKNEIGFTKEDVYGIVVNTSKDRLSSEAEVMLASELFKANTPTERMVRLTNLLCK